MISKALTRIYYIIEGAGIFTIDNQMRAPGHGDRGFRLKATTVSGG